MEYVIAVALIWAIAGIWFVISTNSRGVFADILFAALWPFYLYTDWKAGRL